MARQFINIGTSANDGTGDTLRVAFDKINDNFIEVYDNIPTDVSELDDANNIIFDGNYSSLVGAPSANTIAQWNEAYSWGDHNTQGYYDANSSLIVASEIQTGNFVVPPGESLRITVAVNPSTSINYVDYTLDANTNPIALVETNMQITTSSTLSFQEGGSKLDLTNAEIIGLSDHLANYEVDPIFNASPAAGITNDDISSIRNTVNTHSGSATIVVGGAVAVIDNLTVRIQNDGSNNIEVAFNYNASAAVSAGSDSDDNIFNGTTTFVAGNTTWSVLKTITLAGTTATFTIADHSFHNVYRGTVMVRSMPDGGPTLGDAYCILERLK